MSTIKIDRECNWSDDQVTNLRDSIGRKLQEMGIDVEWQEDLATIAGKGVKGHCQLNNAGVNLDLKLDMFAGMFKGTIESRLEDYLDKLDTQDQA